MRRIVVAVLLVLGCALPAQAQRQPLRPELAAIDFLVGRWSAGHGIVAETGETSTGSSTITVEAGGAALLRRDRTDLFAADGKPNGGFDQIMMVYPEAGTLHADYADGTHVIHYASAVIVPGHSVVFTSAPQPGGPTFRLGYELTSPTTLAVRFELAPPGESSFRPVATGTLTKAVE